MAKRMKKNFSRRSFLKGACAGTCGALIHQGGFTEPMMAFAAPPIAAGLAGDNAVFILVNFAGGASYNVAPPTIGEYRDKNPTIWPTGAPDITVDQALHPSLELFKSKFDEGKMALFNSVGYPSPNRSHSDSTDIWMRGSRDGSGPITGGWAARLTAQMSSLVSGVSLSGSNLLIEGGNNPPRSLNNLSSLGESSWGSELDMKFRQDTRSMVIDQAGDPANQSKRVVKEAILGLDRTAATIERETSADPPLVDGFPNTGFGRACRDAARLINAPSLGVRFIYLQRGGFDTHSGEGNRLTSNLDDVNAGLAALDASVYAMGRGGDVIVATMSEFGRTWENGSQGTDHGHAAPLFIYGERIKGGQKNPVPSAAAINASGSFLANHEVDFRAVYKKIVEEMGYDANAVFPDAPSNFIDIF